jgi:ElaB/YqjD/DUF883 family membrane-anchored ribosome-binding protein
MKTGEQATNALADNAAEKAEHAIRATQRVTNDALDGLSTSVNGARDRISPAISRATEQAAAYAHRGIDAVRNGTNQVRERALHAGDVTADYIKHDPIKSVLIAAAAGAALMALVGLLSRSRRD